MFDIFSIQADHGDALLVRYGALDLPRYILVDGGPSGTRDNIVELLDSLRNDKPLTLEILVVTHYDLDHIDGIIELLETKPSWLTIEDIWFNGLHQLQEADVLGPKQGDRLSGLIVDKGLPWNMAFGGKAIDNTLLKPMVTEKGMSIHVLSPDTDRLAKLAYEWEQNRIKDRDAESAEHEDLLGRSDTWPPGPFPTVAATKFAADHSVPNGSSIALILEYDSHKLLLTGDAFSDVVEAGLKRRWPTPIDISLLKVSHHGSQGNTSEQLLQSIQCHRYLISTNGKQFRHPDNALIARLLAYGGEDPELIFNYAQSRTTCWQSPPQGWPAYSVRYPLPGCPYVHTDLLG